MIKECLHCGYIGYVYGIPTGSGVSAPFCPQCGINNKLVDVTNLKSSNKKYMVPVGHPNWLRQLHAFLKRYIQFYGGQYYG